jgi:hypothetical protein
MWPGLTRGGLAPVPDGGVLCHLNFFAENPKITIEDETGVDEGAPGGSDRIARLQGRRPRQSSIRICHSRMTLNKF